MVGQSLMRLARVAAWLACVAATGASHADEATTCTMDAFENHAAAVIEPCRRLLERATLPAADRAAALAVRARAYALKGLLDLAVGDLDEAIRLAPRRADFYVRRSTVQFRLGRGQAGIADLQFALTLDPRNAVAYRKLGEEYRNAGATEEALDLFSQALLIDAREPYTLLLRSQLLSQLHRFDEALRDADALVAIPSTTINKPGYIDNNGGIKNFHVVALTNRAGLKSTMGKAAEAEADFDSAVATAPASEPLLARGEYWLTQPGQAENALRDFDAAVALTPDDYGAQFERGRALQMLKRYPAALEAFGRASALQPRTGIALMMRARVLRALGRHDDAVREYEKAMALDAWTRQLATNAFVAAGYLPADRRADAAPAAMHAATQACMLDTDCN